MGNRQWITSQKSMTGWGIRSVEKYNGKCWGIYKGLWKVWGLHG
jgi:hypothetical protein